MLFWVYLLIDSWIFPALLFPWTKLIYETVHPKDDYFLGRWWCRWSYTFSRSDWKFQYKSWVDLFHNGKELLEYLEKPDSVLPDILFLDLNMPYFTGTECLIEIRKMSEWEVFRLLFIRPLLLKRSGRYLCKRCECIHQKAR